VLAEAFAFVGFFRTRFAAFFTFFAIGSSSLSSGDHETPPTALNGATIDQRRAGAQRTNRGFA